MRSEKVNENACTPGWSKAGSPISISLSNRPGRRRAGSMAFGLFVVATITTLPSEPSFPVSSIPSMSVRSCATTRFSTSPPGPSSRRGHIASTSSSTMMHGLRARASVNTSRMRASVSPWYAEDSSGPFTMSTAEPVEAAIARARCVFPVPGGPWRSTPRGGLRPGDHDRTMCRALPGSNVGSVRSRAGGRGALIYRKEETSDHMHDAATNKTRQDAPNWRKSSGRVRGISMRSRICAICLSSPPTEAYASALTPRSTACPAACVVCMHCQRGHTRMRTCLTTLAAASSEAAVFELSPSRTTVVSQPTVHSFGGASVSKRACTPAARSASSSASPYARTEVTVNLRVLPSYTTSSVCVGVRYPRSTA